MEEARGAASGVCSASASPRDSGGLHSDGIARPFASQSHVACICRAVWPPSRPLSATCAWVGMQPPESWRPIPPSGRAQVKAGTTEQTHSATDRQSQAHHGRLQKGSDNAGLLVPRSGSARCDVVCLPITAEWGGQGFGAGPICTQRTQVCGGIHEKPIAQEQGPRAGCRRAYAVMGVAGGTGTFGGWGKAWHSASGRDPLDPSPHRLVCLLTL